MTAPAVLLAAAPAFAGPVAERLLPRWLLLGAEYRVETVAIDPIDPSGALVRDVHWTEQRLRLDAGLRVPGIVGVYIQLDALDGVLFGDNGDFGRGDFGGGRADGGPEPSFGLAVTSRWPNAATWEVGLRPGADPLDPGSYVPRLRPVDVVRVNRAWAEVLLPVGVLRIGRQPYAYGAAIASHDGGRHNRWGVSRYSDTADRVLFGTRLDLAWKALTGTLDPDEEPRADRGLLLALAYDWGTQDDIYRSADDLHQVLGGLQWLVPEAGWGGAVWRDVQASAFVAYRWNEEFDTAVWGLPLRLAGQVGPVAVDLQYTLLVGATREVSEGFALLTSQSPRRQDIFAMGAHARVDVRLGPVELTVEGDYASGDDDPRSGTDLTIFNFARDFNVGLLLFEHVLAFESARSAAVGIENLSQLGADAFPLTEVATEGRFTNAIALFPQAKVDVVATEDHRAHVRLGVLMAWPAAAGGAVDPVMTTLREDGDRIDDDRVNFHGGSPGGYYGTEIDLQLGWIFRDFFHWTVEAAVLFPGSSLRDRDGLAVVSYLVENRVLFVF